MTIKLVASPYPKDIIEHLWLTIIDNRGFLKKIPIFETLQSTALLWHIDIEQHDILLFWNILVVRKRNVLSSWSGKRSRLIPVAFP